ncbi:hypothetical protein M513_13507 [Trichuris suis]|uniref:Uncharacterized protein n=1 Tax=Trichuris suis TaxID=68888 RepID=A0A085LKW9_9BILA|nr:hypothetical protein M513_13507 [Trichuris suis]
MLKDFYQAECCNERNRDTMQSVTCNMFEYMKHCVEYMISRLPRKNVDETEATVSSQFSERSEPQGWHQVLQESGEDLRLKMDSLEKS